ncbi:hypothetical protein C8R47DRAFT_1095600 [Mycena vitilis]|nr:hypothetical protein C8R47DRAFT_1095600 [Mycena vitilis]
MEDATMVLVTTWLRWVQCQTKTGRAAEQDSEVRDGCWAAGCCSQPRRWRRRWSRALVRVKVKQWKGVRRVYAGGGHSSS